MTDAVSSGHMEDLNKKPHRENADTNEENKHHLFKVPLRKTKCVVADVLREKRISWFYWTFSLTIDPERFPKGPRATSVVMLVALESLRDRTKYKIGKGLQRSEAPLLISHSEIIPGKMSSINRSSLAPKSSGFLSWPVTFLLLASPMLCSSWKTYPP